MSLKDKKHNLYVKLKELVEEIEKFKESYKKTHDKQSLKLVLNDDREELKEYVQLCKEYHKLRFVSLIVNSHNSEEMQDNSVVREKFEYLIKKF